MSEPNGGPWTSHGHAIAGVSVAGPRPSKVARCGGPPLCGQCGREAARALDEKADGSTEPSMTTLGTITVNLRILASFEGGEEHEVATAAANLPFGANLAPDTGALTQAIKHTLCDCSQEETR